MTITPGYISNSTIVARGDVDCLFYIDKHGHMTPYMDHYLIIPEEVFSARQIKIALRKWRKNAPASKANAVVLKGPLVMEIPEGTT